MTMRSTVYTEGKSLQCTSVYRVLLPSIWPSSCLYTRLQGDSTMYSTVGNMYTKIIPQVVRRYVET